MPAGGDRGQLLIAYGAGEMTPHDGRPNLPNGVPATRRLPISRLIYLIVVALFFGFIVFALLLP